MRSITSSSSRRSYTSSTDSGDEADSAEKVVPENENAVSADADARDHDVPADDAPSDVQDDVLEDEDHLPPGQTAAREYRVYLGPKEAERLEAAGANLDQAIQKGWFPALTDFFTAVLAANAAAKRSLVTCRSSASVVCA